MSLLSGKPPRKQKRGGSVAFPDATSGPWDGVRRGVGNPEVYRSGRWAYLMYNLYIPPGEATAATSRPSVTRVGSLSLGGQGQCVFEHVRADKTTIDRLLFAGGKMYRWNGDIASPSATDITPAATTISTTSQIFCCSFNDKVIVSDGVNMPWAYDPVTSTRAFINIDGSGTSWVATGAPWVYAAKLFFIASSLSSTNYTTRMVWSEEADETIGYMQTGGGTTYTNKWDLVQTGSNQLTAAVATNVGIYYFRPDSIGFISGQVNSTFQTTATHDAVSSTVGTLSPGSVILVDNDIYFLDRHGRQWRISSKGLEPLWEGFDPDSAAQSAVTTARAFYLPRVRLVVSATTDSSTDAYQVWDVATGHSFYYWFLPGAVRVMGSVRDTTGLPQMLMIGKSPDGLTDGYVYRFRTPGETVTNFDDTLWVADATNHARVLYPVLGADLERDQHFIKLTAEVYNYVGAASRTYLANGQSATSVANTGNFQTERVTWGINAFGRNYMPAISCADRAHVNVRFMRVTAERVDAGYYPDGA